MKGVFKEGGELCSDLWEAVSQDSGFRNIGKLFLAIVIIVIFC
jgi:hypothetical protein